MNFSTTVSSKGQITIPLEIRKRLGYYFRPETLSKGFSRLDNKTLMPRIVSKAPYILILCHEGRQNEWLYYAG